MKIRYPILLGLVGVACIGLAVWQISQSQRGLEITRFKAGDLPVTVIAPQSASADRPVVLIGHGFAGSGVLMRGIALALARAGYVTVSWDFNGHGGNPNPLQFEASSGGLDRNAEAALQAVQELNLGDPGRVAILGHSMGSGVALDFGLAHPETAATIAISPVTRQITPGLPHNLLLLAGSLEPSFVQNAEELLEQAGGQGGDPAQGTGRRFITVQGVEHISILFSPAAQSTVRDWLDATFDPQPGAQPYTERRMLWFGLAVLGTTLVAMAVAPLVGERRAASPTQAQPALWRRMVGLAGGAFGATLILWGLGALGLDLSELSGLLVGGYLMLWFGIAGLLSLLLGGLRPGKLHPRPFWGGLLVFAILWAGVGLLGHFVWLPWLLIPKRLLLWLPANLLCLPWFLGVGEASQRSGWLGQAGWWAFQSALILGAQFLALQLTPTLFFLMLILPLFPVVLGVHALAAGPQRSPWAFALSGAMFIAWIGLAVFPLS